MKIDENWVKNLVRIIAIEKIEPNTWNPRKMEENSYNALKKSINDKGFKSIILVRKHEDKFQIIDGEHRFKVLKELGNTHIPAIVVEESDKEARIQTLTFNVQAEDDAIQLSELLKELTTKYKFSVEELTERLGKTEDEIESYLNLTDFDWKSLEVEEGDVEIEDLVEEVSHICFTVPGVIQRHIKDVLEYVKRKENLTGENWKDESFIRIMEEKEKEMLEEENV